MNEGRPGKGLGRDAELEREGVEGKAEGERRERSAGFEEGSEGALVGESGVAEHGNEVLEGEEGVGVGRDHGRP